MHEKRPKYAGPIYFHADVCQRTIFEIARNGMKKGINMPARFISARMYTELQIGIFVAVFTNFAVTLARQPSAASLAPRLNYHSFEMLICKA